MDIADDLGARDKAREILLKEGEKEFKGLVIKIQEGRFSSLDPGYLSSHLKDVRQFFEEAQASPVRLTQIAEELGKLAEESTKKNKNNKDIEPLLIARRKFLALAAR